MSELDFNAVMSQVLQALPDASVVVFDRQLRVLSVAGNAHVWGGAAAEAYVGGPVSELLTPERWPAYEPLLGAALSGRSGSTETESPDHSHRYLVDVEPLRDGAGELVAGVCFWRDITTRARLMEELGQQQRLLDLAHDAIIVREPQQSRVTYWNREAEQLYGYTAQEAHGQITHNLLQTGFPSSERAVDEVLFGPGRWDGELRHTRKDGSRIVVASRQALVRDDDGRPLAIIELNSDITERRQAEDSLREAEQQFRGLMESAPDATVIVDEHARIVLVNARMEELFGYRRDELIGEPVEMLLPKGLRRRHVDHRDEYLTSPRARPMGAGLDLLARRKGGGEFLAEISLSPVQTDTGLLISASIRDISKQLLRQLEQALVPRMKLDERWHLAWRYRPSLNTMLLGGDFIGVCERPLGSLSLLIGDVTGQGPAAAGTGAMLRAAWLGAVQADVELDSIPRMLHRLLIEQADQTATLATACLVEVDRDGRSLRVIRAGHDSPLLVTPSKVVALNSVHGPALGLGGRHDWPTQHYQLPPDAAIMLFTDGLTERRAALRPGQIGFDQLLPQIDADTLLTQPPERAIDEMLAQVFPDGTGQLDDDLAVILLTLRAADIAQAGDRARVA
ncbi:MAG TPA: PAS domain S-box protein [Solirubrobacteraceae bacterium]